MNIQINALLLLTIYNLTLSICNFSRSVDMIFNSAKSTKLEMHSCKPPHLSEVNSNIISFRRYNISRNVDFPNGGELTSPDGRIVDIPINSSIIIPYGYGYIKYKYEPIVISHNITKSFLLFIPITYKGKTYQCLMDTGSPYSTLPFLDSANKSMHNTNKRGQIYITSSHVYLGSMNISHYLKIQYLPLKNNSFPFSIGRDVLAHLSIQINIFKHKIVVWPKGLPNDYEPQSLYANNMINLSKEYNLSIIHLNYSNSKQTYSFNAHIGKKKYNLIYDTGTSVTSIMYTTQNVGKFLKTLKLITPYATYKCNVYLTHILINHLDITDGIVGMLDSPISSGSQPDTSGNLLFVNYNIWVDFRDHKVLVIPRNQSFSKIFKQNK